MGSNRIYVGSKWDHLRLARIYKDSNWDHLGSDQESVESLDQVVAVTVGRHLTGSLDIVAIIKQDTDKKKVIIRQGSDQRQPGKQGQARREWRLIGLCTRAQDRRRQL